MKIIAVCNEVHLIGMHEFCALEKLPEDEHDQHDGELDVVRDKVDGAKGWTEAGPALDKDDDDVEADGEDGPDGVCPVSEREEMLQTLGFHAGSEP